jgi:hypothetical protein
VITYPAIVNVTGVPAGMEGGVDSEEPFVFPASGEDSGDETGDGDKYEESTSDESLFG